MKIAIKNKVTVAVCSAFLAIGAFSCQTDLLDPQPTTIFSNLVVFDTPARISLQVNGLYAAVKNGNFYGGRYQVYGDVRADDFINRTSNSITAQLVWNHTLTETSQNDVINTWEYAYNAINQINVFLDGMDANSAKFVAPVFPADYSTTTANQYKAEARFLRALSYYALLQLYAKPYADNSGNNPGLPLRLKAEASLPGNDLARSTVAEVYAQILDDLQYAEDNLPLTYPTATAPSTRAHRNTAIALKTRVYLSMGRYSDVITTADRIVSKTAPFTATTGVQHVLSPSVTNVFPSQTTTESILSFPFTAQNTPGTQNQLGNYYLPNLPQSAGGTGEFYLNANGILANPAWAANDTRRVNWVTVYNGASYLKKYSSPTPFLDPAPVIRYAEVLLNLAEARSRVNGANDAQALALLNAVRTRSNGTAYTQATVDNILLERRIEFLGEGIRNFDIMRLNATIPGKGNISAVPPGTPRYIWPIPSTEIATNRLIVQN